MPVQQMLLGAGGVAKKYGVEDLFKTYLYIGNGATRSINTGLAMNAGGLVWIKRRNGANDYVMGGTGIGDNKYLSSNNTDYAHTSTARFKSLESTGFQIGDNSLVNSSSNTYSSWSFKKQKKFFTICTWTGTGSTLQTISHDLGSVPGCILIKNTSSSQSWGVYHRGANGGTNPEQYLGHLTDAAFAQNVCFNFAAPTSTQFQIKNDEINTQDDTYVAYLFAHEEAVFGDNEDQKLISCGTYTGNGTSGHEITLPFEPGFIMIKCTSKAGTSWAQFDSMRGVVQNRADEIYRLDANLAESGATNFLEFTPTGIRLEIGEADDVNANGENYIYIAVAAETGKTMKAIEDPTKVFAMDTGNSSSTIPTFDSGFPVDWGLVKHTSTNNDWDAIARKTGTYYLAANTNAAESSDNGFTWDSNVGFMSSNGYSSSYQAWMWKRHAGFDVVTYIGNDANRTIAHNLGQAAEMMIVKRRSDTRDWFCYHTGGQWPSGAHVHFHLNENHAAVDENTHWQDTDPSATHFSIGTSSDVNQNGENFIALLFASVTGVSKVGYYTGNSSTPPTINLGFAPRFVMIKNMNQAVNWMVFDTLRGLGSGNDPILKFNQNAGQETGHDVLTTSSTGFTPSGGLGEVNGNGNRIIYYAHA